MDHDPSREPPAAILSRLRANLPDHVVEVRSSTRSLLGMRRSTSGHLIVRVHSELLNDADCPVLVAEWVKRRGKGGPGQSLSRLLHAAMSRRAQEQASGSHDWLAMQPILGSTLPADADNCLRKLAAQVHHNWFADLPVAPIIWGRRPPRRRLSHLRFGCYRRKSNSIELSPRLARPWIARGFIEHVLHHEYCHHRQAMTPLLRREGVHSPRFRAWEQTYPDLTDALRWEHLALPWLLDDSPPPWYVAPGSTTCQPSPPGFSVSA